MKNSWAQPSLSRDFALLSAAILFILCIISVWATFSTYTRHAEMVAVELEKESRRVEAALNLEMDNANYMLNSLGKQIVLDPDRNLVKLAQVLKSFDKKDHIYSILSWVNPDQQLAVSSNKGVLDKPVDISDRDYVKKALADPWKMNIGRPIEGRVSERWIIPVSMGITDYTGKFIGTVMISMDIGVLTDRLSSVVKRDGISFAIVSKSLIPITQVSDDKDFVANNFPVEKLVNFNFSKNPSGLISQGGMFWDMGNYAYYRAIPDSPYIVLLGYDARYSDEAVRNSLWSRLLQMLAMAVFFMLFLWITRTRMIRPIMEMTNIAAKVAKGHGCEELPKGGPIEIEGLATQIRKVSEYIEENERIENELRNKIFHLKKAKDIAEMDRRSQSEFLAYISQEMRTPLNSIIGGAQVLKDQLHGPLENRQYATDIYSTSNNLMNLTQDLMAITKAEIGYLELSEKSVDVAAVINKAVRFISDKMQVEKLGIKIQIPELTPRLMADEFRLQQILINLLLHALDHAAPEGIISLEASVIAETRDKSYYVFVVSSAGQSPYTSRQLMTLANDLAGTPPYRLVSNISAFANEHTNISLELAKTLVALHDGLIDITQSPDNSVAIAVFFPGERIRPAEIQEQ